MSLGVWGGLGVWRTEVDRLYFGSAEVKTVMYFDGTELKKVKLYVNSEIVWEGK